MGKVIAITSGKGGVGKTVFASNLGVTLAQRNIRTVLIDMDAGLRNMDLSMGLENKVVYDLSDVCSGVCRVKQALVRDNRFPQLYLMSASQRQEKATVEEEQIQSLCATLREFFDYVIIDAPAGIGVGFDLSVTAADQAVILTVPEHAAVRDADKVDQLLRQKGIKQRQLVINKVKEDLIHSSVLPELEEIAEAVRAELLGIIAYDENIHLASNLGIPVVTRQDNYIAENFNRIADRILQD